MNKGLEFSYAMWMYIDDWSYNWTMETCFT